MHVVRHKLMFYINAVERQSAMRLCKKNDSNICVFKRELKYFHKYAPIPYTYITPYVEWTYDAPNYFYNLFFTCFYLYRMREIVCHTFKFWSGGIIISGIW